ncbi:organic cation/carnitine transporter 7-like [Andrographis paniculata]|uniref:organic cation/carnitine transporter 7-like n=1 Tax=Andrographis paniculata TaxID=175694 RepID=UPI0021E6E5A8|nr:organic cation/carnitine transporter 7-like [Andrographis paniculata]XP_051132079.1 organic cation/carnitine transporter 7-like [Andrographis paniculata]
MGDQNVGHHTLDEAISTLGFGKFQSLAIVFAGISWLSEAMEITLLSFIGPAVKSEWSLSPTEESLLSTAVFAGMLVGAVFWGLISDAYGRRKGMRGVIVVITVAGVLSALSPDYKSLIAIRCIVGFGVSGGHVYASWFLEFVPSVNRAAWTLALTGFWIIGELLEALLAWIIMPRLGWRWLLALSSAPALITLMITLTPLIPESPRFLFIEGRTNEAMDILKKVARINRKELPAGRIHVANQSTFEVESIPSDEAILLAPTQKKANHLQVFTNTMFELFSIKLLRTTLLLLLLHLGYTFAYYGIMLMTSSMSSNQTACDSLNVVSASAEDTKLYTTVLIASSAEIPGLFIAAFLVEKIGRKRSMETLTSLALISLLPLSVRLNDIITTALLFCARMLIFSTFSSLSVYAKEVYPTSIRASGSGLATAVGRIGGMVCPLVAVGLVRGCQQALAVAVFGIVILVSGICVVFFPVETKGRALADTVEDEE